MISLAGCWSYPLCAVFFFLWGCIQTAGQIPNLIFSSCVTQIWSQQCEQPKSHGIWSFTSSHLSHFHMRSKSDRGRVFWNVTSVWTVSLELMQLWRHSRAANSALDTAAVNEKASQKPSLNVCLSYSSTLIVFAHKFPFFSYLPSYVLATCPSRNSRERERKLWGIRIVQSHKW